MTTAEHAFLIILGGWITLAFLYAAAWSLWNAHDRRSRRVPRRCGTPDAVDARHAVDARKPCLGTNPSICVGEGCYGETCLQRPYDWREMADFEDDYRRGRTR